MDAINNGHPARLDGNDVMIVADPAGAIDGGGNVRLTHGASGWRLEAANKLVNGIPYGTGPNTVAALNAALAPGQMVIEITKLGSNDPDPTNQYKITINGTSYFVDRTGNGLKNRLILQSHWGSGVKFQNAAVRRAQ